MLLGSLQESLLSLLAYDAQRAQLIRNAVDIGLWGGPYRIIATRIYEYLDKFKKPPGDHLPDLLGDLLEGSDKAAAELYADYVNAVHETYSGINADYVMSKLELVIERNTLRSTAIDLSKALQRDTEESLNEAKSIIARAGRQQVSLFDPGTRLSDKVKALSFLNGGVSTFPTGIRELDRRGFGPTRQELFLYIANTKTGKSWFLIHLAKIALLQTLRVCHITLEMSEDRCAQRYFQALFALAKRNEALPTTRLKLDQLGRISGFDDVRINPKLTLEDKDIDKKLQAKIDQWGTRLLKNIYIKQFPTRTLTINQLKAYLDNLEVTEGFVPDVLIVDYPDLFRIDKTEFRLGLSQVYQDLRGLAVSRNLAVIVVSQSNREGSSAKWVGLEHTAEHYGKAQDADCVVTYSQTEAEHKLGLARLYVAAGRNDEDKVCILITQQYGIGQFVISSALMGNNYFDLLEAEGSK
jgi:replicative DNA helicase